MAYSQIEQQTRDLDLFFRDNNKYIHIATAGGQIPDELAENDVNNETFLIQIKEIVGTSEVETNPNLIQILGIPDNGLENYLIDFIEMARRGFYCYDKTKLGDFENKFFHLVAWPMQRSNKMIKDTNKLFSINNALPEHFEPFDLFEYF